MKCTVPPGKVIRIRCAVYISSSRDFSQAESRSAVAHDIKAGVDGQLNNKRFEPAVLRVSTFVNFFGGWPSVVGTVIEPRTCTNYDHG
jgi:hypothetical protein